MMAPKQAMNVDGANGCVGAFVYTHKVTRRTRGQGRHGWFYYTTEQKCAIPDDVGEQGIA
jgi:hypothetical protein